MDTKRKLEILAAADFSEWRKWGRAKQEGKDPSEVHGFGNALVGMAGAASTFADGYQREKSLEILLYGYRCLSEDYATIPFYEIDPQDPDFRFLFQYRERLNELGQKVEAFATRTQENGMKASREWPEYQELDKIIGELMKTNYRSQVLEKYGISFSEPSPK